MTYHLSNFVKKYFGAYCDLHFPNETEEITAKADVWFDRLMNNAPDMGVKGNMMASNLDITAAFFAYYEATDRRLSGDAIEELMNGLFNDYKKFTVLTDMNRRSYVKPLYYRLYSSHAKKVEQHKAKGEWKDTWSLRINPDGKEEGIRYDLVGCPLLKFARMNGYEHMMPYICRFDYIFEKILHAKLIRTHTEALGGDGCDYWFVADKSETAEKYKDFKGV